LLIRCEDDSFIIRPRHSFPSKLIKRGSAQHGYAVKRLIIGNFVFRDSETRLAAMCQQRALNQMQGGTRARVHSVSPVQSPLLFLPVVPPSFHLPRSLSRCCCPHQPRLPHRFYFRNPLRGADLIRLQYSTYGFNNYETSSDGSLCFDRTCYRSSHPRNIETLEYREQHALLSLVKSDKPHVYFAS